mmetsp:Transcript_12844/g.45486  ORF Transcript_12844/g.45486 Transcript_12844/m.45486 type:complete len:420 (+) Transcript_12844:2573-3832(+)
MQAPEESSSSRREGCGISTSQTKRPSVETKHCRARGTQSIGQPCAATSTTWPSSTVALPCLALPSAASSSFALVTESCRNEASLPAAACGLPATDSSPDGRHRASSEMAAGPEGTSLDACPQVTVQGVPDRFTMQSWLSKPDSSGFRDLRCAEKRGMNHDISRKNAVLTTAVSGLSDVTSSSRLSAARPACCCSKGACLKARPMRQFGSTGSQTPSWAWKDATSSTRASGGQLKHHFVGRFSCDRRSSCICAQRTSTLNAGCAPRRSSASSKCKPWMSKTPSIFMRLSPRKASGSRNSSSSRGSQGSASFLPSCPKLLVRMPKSKPVSCNLVGGITRLNRKSVSTPPVSERSDSIWLLNMNFTAGQMSVSLFDLWNLPSIRSMSNLRTGPSVTFTKRLPRISKCSAMGSSNAVKRRNAP